jgi:RND family efflux transporter MFP subunit
VAGKQPGAAARTPGDAVKGPASNAAASASPPPSQAPAAALTVDTIAPSRTTLVRTLAASGSISARDELLIGADVSGVRLTEVLAEVGTLVKRGQLLARGDDSTLRHQLAQHEALVRQAEVELAQAASNLERAERIKDSGVFSAEAVQTRRTAVDAASAKLELARAQRREWETMVARTRITAPADGVISRRGATVGAVMQPGTELFRLIRDEQLEWLAELPAAALTQVKPGAVARVKLDDGSAIEARVRLVAPTIDARTRNGQVHVALPRGVALRAGGHASGEIVIGDAEVMTLPESVIFVRDGEHYVWLVGRDEVARRHRIDTGTRQRGLVEVQSLEADARVVSTGAGFVKEGERVRVSARPAATRPAA